MVDSISILTKTFPQIPSNYSRLNHNLQNRISIKQLKSS